VFFIFHCRLTDADIFALLKLQLKVITVHFFLQTTYTKTIITQLTIMKMLTVIS